MPLMKLSDKQMHQFDEQPEAAMGLHVAQLHDSGSDAASVIFVLGGQVALIPDEDARRQISELLDKLWGRQEEYVTVDVQEEFEKWRSDLPAAPLLRGLQPVRPSSVAFTLPLPSYVSPAPKPPQHVYGHLPFTGRTGRNDVFYRCEPWPISRWVDQAKAEVKAHTYACPHSELPFFPTGFAAVGRYALPNLMPACYRWKLQPVPNTSLDCGTSVPLFGQAGGGVEVRFRSRTKNQGPIGSPVVLPPL
jgi:hypothetical protein